MVLYLKLPAYLGQWFVSVQGGGNPLKLTRGSVEWIILERFLQRPPEGYTPELPNGENTVAVVIPEFKLKDPDYYYYLPPCAMRMMRETLARRFDLDMWREIHNLQKMGVPRKELIWAFMEKFGIDETETNWCAIEKRYQRKADLYRKNTGTTSMQKKRKNRSDFSDKNGGIPKNSKSSEFSENSKSSEFSENSKSSEFSDYII